MRKGKTSPSPSQGGGANLLPLGEIREGFLCLLFGLLLVGCNSRQQQAHEVTSDFDKAKEEQVIRQLVDDVYKEVNVRWDKSSEGTGFEGSMEDNYTTEDWQNLYLDLRGIEAEKEAVGDTDGKFFSEDGNVWTMGSVDLPFTTDVVRVEFSDNQTADVYFYLKPAESDPIPILWEMKKVGDKWLIHNFIEGDEAYEYEYDYTEHIKDYIQRNQ
jgi:hypothetical protein